MERVGHGRECPRGDSPLVGLSVDVRAEARTYLRDNGKCTDKSNSNGNSNSKSKTNNSNDKSNSKDKSQYRGLSTTSRKGARLRSR
jgi:hypothetical protein